MSFVALSTVTFPPELRNEIHAIGFEMLLIAKTQPGFISIAFHESSEENSNKNNHTMMYWEWESKESHEACMQSPAWAQIMEKSDTLFQSKGVELSIKTYEKIA